MLPTPRNAVFEVVDSPFTVDPINIYNHIAIKKIPLHY
jgi:hypothetical protein